MIDKKAIMDNLDARQTQELIACGADALAQLRSAHHVERAFIGALLDLEIEGVPDCEQFGIAGSMVGNLVTCFFHAFKTQEQAIHAGRYFWEAFSTIANGGGISPLEEREKRAKAH